MLRKRKRQERNPILLRIGAGNPLISEGFRLKKNLNNHLQKGTKMNQPQLSPTEQAHQGLRNVLLNGRILINGLSLTGNELGAVIQGEMMLFEKAMSLDKARALDTSKKKLPDVPEKVDANVIPLKQPKPKKE